MSLKGKVVVVTGASRGIGHAIAHAFQQQGAVVIGTATSEVGIANVPGHGMLLDVSSDTSVKDFFSLVKEQHGAPEILVNNAGITADNLFVRMRKEQWDSVLNTNLTSIYRTTHACMRDMMKARAGRVINITSVVAQMGNPGQSNYCAAKAGVIGFTKSLAKEMASLGVTVNAVAPGFIKTQMTERLDEKQQESILSQIPSKRMGSPEDIAHAVLFLASEGAAYITGQTLHVNGGMYV